MINKSLLRVGVLALSFVAIVSAKSYDIILATTTKVGNVQLDRGSYKMKVDGANAIFTENDSRKSFTVPVKAKDGSRKYEATQVNSAKQGDMDQIKTIDLGGSKTTLEFAQ